MLNCFFSLYGLDIRLNSIFESIESNPIGCTSVIDLTYSEDGNLGCVFERDINRHSVFKILKNHNIKNISYEEIKYKKNAVRQFVKNGISYNLNSGYQLIFTSEEIDFKNEIIDTWNGANPCPYYMYIKNKNDDIVFNFNTWRLDKKEFYQKTYHNSLSEEKEFTEEESIDQLKVFPASTEWSHHTAVNKKLNRIAVVFDNYNGQRGALVIFEVLYDAVCNDDRVRVRTEPNLDCETKTFINKNDAVKITDQSDKKFEIDGKKYYWYEVELADGTTGWVYGKYLDIE